MSGELTWRLPWGDLRVERVRSAVAAIVKSWPGVSFAVQVDDTDMISAIFVVPNALVQAASDTAAGEQEAGADDEASPDEADQDEEGLEPETWTIELSFYDLDSDGRVLALEDEWADNLGAWDAACALAEELAESLDGELLEL